MTEDRLLVQYKILAEDYNELNVENKKAMGKLTEMEKQLTIMQGVMDRREVSVKDLKQNLEDETEKREQLEKLLDEANEHKSTVMKMIEQSKEMEEQLNELHEKMETIELDARQLKVQEPDGIEGIDIDGLWNMCHKLEQQVSSMATIQNLYSEDIQKQFSEKDEMRLQLQTDLMKQEESHLQEIEELKKKFQTELDLKDNQCLELEQTIERLRSDYDVNVCCSICLEQWDTSSAHRLVSLACGHLFGDSCIRSCLNQLNECPQCRAPAYLPELRYLYGRPI